MYVGLFENLSNTNHKPTSPTTPFYNCIAWAAADEDRWWQPNVPFDTGYYWPAGAPENMLVGSLVAAFQCEGFKLCPNGTLASGMTKIAIYANDQNEWTHAARQLPSGKWTSKLGKLEDIEHDTVEAVAGEVYGSLYCYMAKAA